MMSSLSTMMHTIVQLWRIYLASDLFSGEKDTVLIQCQTEDSSSLAGPGNEASPQVL